jgi:aminomethyltransferase
MQSRLKRTPLYPLYADYGAKTVEFGGWELPVQFEGILKEHEAARTRSALFDVSHMGEIVIEGPGALELLQRLTTNDAASLEIGAVQYTLMCDDKGGTVDDLLVYKLAEEKYMAVVNASNAESDFEWFKRHAACEVAVTNVSDTLALLALQGPLAAEILKEAAGDEVRQLAPFHFADGIIVCGVKALVSRTGYTGEDGFELYVPSSDAGALWRRLLEIGRDRGSVPAGLGARDTLRFEARLPLYGQELGPDISPLEAGLGTFVKLDKGDFIGREALLAQRMSGVPRKLVGLEMIDRGIARHGFPVYSPNGKAIGEVTSGTQSPTLKRRLALALIDSRYAAVGNELSVDVRGKRLRALVVPTPFYRRPKV